MNIGARRRVIQVAAFAAAAAVSLGAAQAVTLEVFSVDPAFSPFNVSGRTVTVKGVGFTPSTTVKFDGVSASATFVDSRTLTATVPTVASARVSTVSVSDSATGTDEFHPFMYSGSTVYYVAPLTGNDGNTGTNPAAPKRTIGSAFGAVSGTTPTEIRVGAGRTVEMQLGIPANTILSCGWNAGFTVRDPDVTVTDIDANRGGWIIRSVGLAAPSVIDGCTFRNGLRDGFGGGAIPVTADNAVINNNVLVGNISTTMGGGIYMTASTSYGLRTTVSNNVIVGNRAHAKNGGGIVIYPNYNTQQMVRVNITGNQIVGNRAVNARGGGVALTTGAYAGYNAGKLAVSGNVIGYNRSRTGGGVDASLLTYGDSFVFSVDNNLIVGNSAMGAGGGLAFQGLGFFRGRVAVNTIAANAAGAGQTGGFFISGGVSLPASFTASDLILWGNLNGDVGGQAPDRITHSDAGILLSGAGNISADPDFVGGPLGGYYLRQADPNNPTSPAVDAGSGSAASLALDPLTTRPDLVPDAGMADQGFHYPPLGTPSPAAIGFTRVDPTFGDLGGSDWVLIRGSGFDPGATVQFGGVAATKVLYQSPSRLLSQPPPHALGLVNVKVINPDATFVEAANAYKYADVDPPAWTTAVGVQSARTGVDCVRSVVLDWEPAADAISNPVTYEIYRQECAPSGVNTVPCSNFGFIPNSLDLIGQTPETYYVDLALPASGQDPNYIYNVRARDAAAPPPNREWNFAKRTSLASKVTTDTTPPSPVGHTLSMTSATGLDWEGGPGAVSYGVYRVTNASLYTNPGSLTKLVTLTTVNNDANGDGVTDTKYTDGTSPALSQAFYYKVTSIDPCNLETTSELLP